MTATFNPYGGGWIGGKASAQQGMIAVMNKSNTHVFRYQCHWSSMETSPGVIDWSDVDDLVAVAQANNYLILFPIQDAPSWHTIPLYGNPTKSIPDPAAAGHFCDLLPHAMHLGRSTRLKLTTRASIAGNSSARYSPTR